MLEILFQSSVMISCRRQKITSSHMRKGVNQVVSHYHKEKAKWQAIRRNVVQRKKRETAEYFEGHNGVAGMDHFASFGFLTAQPNQAFSLLTRLGLLYLAYGGFTKRKCTLPAKRMRNAAISSKAYPGRRPGIWLTARMLCYGSGIL
ncbi:hypothetical protein NPIL_32321 [Nephila pilipes]|uniref:Uncharacterized protein n=1 Tax=Nephila pilipes TaxID=299642 RepID=A0A8X6U9U9_NEPPI|nr:hypothetical protein NPIL_32321 [Nephila pilipes]